MGISMVVTFVRFRLLLGQVVMVIWARPDMEGINYTNN